MIDNMKEVYFAQYCATCKYKDLPEIKEIRDSDGKLIDKKKTVCFDCQEVSARPDSHKPVKYKEA